MRVQPKSPKKTILIVAIILAVLVAASLLWYYTFSSSDTKEGSQDTTKTQQEKEKKTISDNKDQDAEKANEPDEKTKNQSVPHEKEKELPQLYEGENTNTSEGLTGVITAKSISGDKLIIRNTINQMLNGGTCELILTSGNRMVKKSAEIAQNPSSSACAGFDVPVTELGPGQWNIEIRVSSGDNSMTLKEIVTI